MIDEAIAAGRVRVIPPAVECGEAFRIPSVKITKKARVIAASKRWNKKRPPAAGGPQRY